MTAIAATNLLTGRRAEHRHSFAQLRDLGLIVNGHDPNYVYNTRNGVAHALGMTAPAAPSVNIASGTTLTGTFGYRVRWYDALANTFSLPSGTTSVSPSAKDPVITQPASPPSRATHWIVERTTNGGSTYFPVNRPPTTADANNTVNGTPIATTSYTDTKADATIEERKVILSVQGVPKPVKWAFANGSVLFLGGGRVHRPTCTVTNASANVSSADGGFTADMVGEQFAVAGDVDGKAYEILTFTDANNIVLSAVYTGTTGTKACTISGTRNRVYFCEPGQGEHYGEQQPGALSNEIILGDDNEPVNGGVGLGPAGALYACNTRMYFHSYGAHPKASLGGRIVPVQGRRGICSDRAIIRIDGYVYGMDTRGMWRMAPGGSPEPISGSIDSEFKNNNLNWSKGDNFLIAYCPFYRHVIFFVAESTDTYPKKGYIWSLERSEWIGTVTYPLGVTAALVLPDTNGADRLNFYMEASGAAASYMWTYGIGDSMGAPPSCPNLNGSVTHTDSSTTLKNSGAAWVTTGTKLKGVPVTKITAAGVEETRIISDNTATLLTVSSAWTTEPAVGDTYRIGQIPFLYRSGRLYMGLPNQKKVFKEVWIWFKNDASAKTLYAKFYYDGSSTAYSDYKALAENGVTITLNTAAIAIDPTAADQHRVRVPLNNKKATDLVIELYQSQAGTPAEVLAIDVFWDQEAATPADVGQRPTRK